MNALLSAIFAVLLFALSPDSGGAAAGCEPQWTDNAGGTAALLAPPAGDLDDNDNALADPDRDDAGAESPTDERLPRAPLAGLLPTCRGVALHPHHHARPNSERGPPRTV